MTSTRRPLPTQKDLEAREALHAQMVVILNQLEFSSRYFEYIDAHRSLVQDFSRRVDRAVVKNMLLRCGLTCTYKARENAFVYEECQEPLCVGYDISVHSCMIEMGLSFTTANARTGDPYCVWARDAAEARDPSFTFEPPWPRLPFDSEATLERAIQFGVELFADARTAFFAAKW